MFFSFSSNCNVIFHSWLPIHGGKNLALPALAIARMHPPLSSRWLNKSGAADATKNVVYVSCSKVRRESL